jgi:hypothetical protein
VEPVRVKVYGLFSRTRRRYLIEAIAGVGSAMVLLIAWYFGWPPMHERLTRPELPPSAYRTLLVAVLNNVPWILMAALAYKMAEVYVVLRILARKEGKK